MTQPQQQASQMVTPQVKPHRGETVLVLGILSLVLHVACVGPILGLIAWVMGKNDLRQMHAGLMDRAGESNTRAGKICGMISVILACVILGLVLLAVLFCFLVFVFVGVSAGTMRHHRMFN